MKFIKLSILLMLVFTSSVIYASQTSATAGVHNWNDPAGWTNGVPGCFDTITIPVGAYVNVNVMVDISGCAPVVVIVSGDLFFVTGKKLSLATGSSVEIPAGGSIIAGGGGGSSNLIQIGAEVVWTAADGDLTGPLTLCEGCSVLPIELAYAYASLQDRTVHLHWSTASEYMNDLFTVERLGVSGTWQEIGQLFGHGTTTIQQYYVFEDNLITEGVYIYRLSQQDWNGEVNHVKSMAIYFDLDNEVKGYYDLMGRKVDSNYSGTVILLFEDGSTLKTIR